MPPIHSRLPADSFRTRAIRLLLQPDTCGLVHQHRVARVPALQHRRRERDVQADLQEVGVQEEEHLVHSHGESLHLTFSPPYSTLSFFTTFYFQKQ